MSNNNSAALKLLVLSIMNDYIKETGDKNPDKDKIQAFIKKKGGDKYILKKAAAIQSNAKADKLKAKHGAKLNYIKKLSHKCADDEELYYYKKGGIVDCGCKKKTMKTGGEVKTPSNVVQNFRNSRLEKEEKKPATKEDTKYTKTTTVVKNSGKSKNPIKESKCGGKVKKHQIGGFIFKKI